MRRIVNIIAILGIVLPALASCRAIANFLHDDEVVAEVGAERLYRSDLDAVIPKGTPAEDSVRLAMQYINTWASDMVYVTIAEQQLSKTEKDVSKELEEYRKSLLKYRYEQLYVNERLDTAVTDETVEEYYGSHQEKFRLARPLVKARFLRISSESPALVQIRKMMGSSDANDLVEADSIAFSSAVKFTTWGNEWIDISVLAREFVTDPSHLQSQMKDRWIRQEDTTGFVNIAFVAEMLPAGELAPVEYSAPQIKDIIISARKQNLINTLEQDLLKDARENGQFVIH